MVLPPTLLSSLLLLLLNSPRSCFDSSVITSRQFARHCLCCNYSIGQNGTSTTCVQKSLTPRTNLPKKNHGKNCGNRLAAHHHKQKSKTFCGRALSVFWGLQLNYAKHGLHRTGITSLDTGPQIICSPPCCSRPVGAKADPRRKHLEQQRKPRFAQYKHLRKDVRLAHHAPSHTYSTW